VKYDSLWVVFGCASDKEVDAMLAALSSGADKVVFTKATGNARAMEPKLLAKRYQDQIGRQAQVEANVRDAINAAARRLMTTDLILVTGSFAVAGEAKRLFLEKQRAGRA
jgi:folylpolyglutamate synthase/dihydropteroate synthase